MKLAFMASDAIALDSLNYLKNSSEWELVCLVSNPDKPKGRGKKLTPNPAAQWAIDNNVELLRPEKTPTETQMQDLRTLGVEAIIVMAYGHILKDCVLNYSKYPCLNLHASLLPELRGASPIETAVALGFKETGVSLMKISPAMDEGDVFASEKIEIKEDETASQLRLRMGTLAAETLSKHLANALSKNAQFTPQDSSRATYARKLDKTDTFLDFRKSAKEICDRIRAFGFGIFEYESEQIKIGSAEFEELDESNSCVGKIISTDAYALRIACGSGVLCARTLQKPCAKMMNAKEFFLGFKMKEGVQLQSFENKPLLRVK